MTEEELILKVLAQLTTLVQPADVETYEGVLNFAELEALMPNNTLPWMLDEALTRGGFKEEKCRIGFHFLVKYPAEKS
jgi:hypothetical protein